jgi:hypothetical protein
MKLRFLLPLLFAIPLHAQSFPFPPLSDPFWKTPDGVREMASLTEAANISSTVGVMLQDATPAQTWVKVANEGDTVTFSVGATVRYGAAQGAAVVSGTPCAKSGGCWNQVDIAIAPGAPPWSIFVSNATQPTGFGPDPIAGTVKELDVLETASVQVVTVNGKPVTVPALLVVVVVPPVPATQTLTCSVTVPNFPVTYTPGSPASTLSAAITSSFNAIISKVVVSCK